MPRPCTCEKFNDGEYDLSQCRLCWLYHHDPKYKELWDKEAKDPKKIILKNLLSPGDVLVMEAAIHSLHTSHPGEFITDVRTSCDAVYENNIHITSLKETDSNVEVIETNYTDAVNNCDKQPIHFMHGYCHMIGTKLKIDLPCTVKAPRLYISDVEKSWINQVQEMTGYKGKFWLLGAASWKNDYTVKKYYQKGIQEVVDRFRGKIQFVQVGAVGHNHSSYDIDGVIDLRGKTDMRQLIRLAYWSSGALCLESFLNHCMAALWKPAVVLCSGFLPPFWVTYPTTTLLSAEGCLPCFKEKPCWKSRVISLKDNDEKNKSLCELPMFGPDPVSKCMYMIEPRDIIRAIEKYYDGGVLSY